MTFCHFSRAARARARRAVRTVVTSVGAALLLAALKSGLILSAEVAAQEARKNRNSVQVTADQLHQIETMNVELYPFRALKFAIGQIAYNEDTTTAVMTPFPGRVTRLVAKVGDTPADLRQGAAAGCGLVVGVTSGSHSRRQLADIPHTHLIDRLAELPPLLVASTR